MSSLAPLSATVRLSCRPVGLSRACRCPCEVTQSSKTSINCERHGEIRKLVRLARFETYLLMLRAIRF